MTADTQQKLSWSVEPVTADQEHAAQEQKIPAERSGRRPRDPLCSGTPCLEIIKNKKPVNKAEN